MFATPFVKKVNSGRCEEMLNGRVALNPKDFALKNEGG